MRLAKIRDHLLAMPGSIETQPFGPEVLVFKVANKMFALVGWKNDPLTINLKADPDEAIEQRERHAGINPGYHMNKQHWNTVTLDGALKDEFVFEMVQTSYDMILDSLPKKKRAEFDAQMDA